MKIALATSQTSSLCSRALFERPATPLFVLHEERTHPKHFLPFYWRGLKKRPLRTLSQILYQGVRVGASLGSGEAVQPVPSNLQTHSINSAEAIKALTMFRPDLLVLDATSIARTELLGIPRLGTLNIHCGINPLYRGGGNPWAFLRGDTKNVGVTLHWVDRGIDTGEIIAQDRVDPRGCSSLDAYQHRCYEKGVDLLLRHLDGEKDLPNTYVDGESSYFPQLGLGTSFQANRAFRRALRAEGHDS